MKIRVSAQGHRPDLQCPVCDGHLVQRTNSFTGEKFYGCSNWSKTLCPGSHDPRDDDDDADLDLMTFGEWRDWGDL